jgi:phosphoglycolate phosphatase-like HAD superfamily hydrolase
MLSRIFSTLVLATAVVLCGHGCRAESVAAAQSEAATNAVAGALSSRTNLLPSWNDGRTKKDILYFVWRVTREGGPDFVPPEARIAVFDNDGTLWSEQPMYVQAAFALDRVKALAPQHPEWKNRQPFKGVLEDDMKAVAASGERGLLEVISATHAGMTTQQFEQIVRDWIATARHPKTGLLYTEMVYQPMLELLQYLRANSFKTFIVSGGGVDFMRPWTEMAYGIPREQVIGSGSKTKFELKDGRPVLLRLPEIEFVDDKAGKPIGIHRVIGRRPILAFGNSDGDLQMLQWTAGGTGARFIGLVHHTDAMREVAYDRASPVGKLDAALDEARSRDWTIVNMKDDWRTVYPR